MTPRYHIALYVNDERSAGKEVTVGSELSIDSLRESISALLNAAHREGWIADIPKSEDPNTCVSVRIGVGLS